MLLGKKKIFGSGHLPCWFFLLILENKKMSKRENPHFVHVMSHENIWREFKREFNVNLKRMQDCICVFLKWKKKKCFLPSDIKVGPVTKTKDIFFALAKWICSTCMPLKNYQLN